MLNVKKLLIKLCKHMTFHQVQVGGSQVTVAAGATAWVTVPKPASGTPIAMVGWYFEGAQKLYAYSWSVQANGATIALCNGGTSSATFKPYAIYLVVD